MTNRRVNKSHSEIVHIGPCPDRQCGELKVKTLTEPGPGSHCYFEDHNQASRPDILCPMSGKTSERAH
jgi:hypothetical protein